MGMSQKLLNDFVSIRARQRNHPDFSVFFPNSHAGSLINLLTIIEGSLPIKHNFSLFNLVARMVKLRNSNSHDLCRLPVSIDRTNRRVDRLQLVHLSQLPAKPCAVPSFRSGMAWPAQRNCDIPSALLRLVRIAWSRLIANNAVHLLDASDVQPLGCCHWRFVLRVH